jgi:hypothetical protein
MAKKETLKDWFSKNDGTGWVDCKTGKPCGRKSKKGSDRPYPACRPTKAQCTSAAKKKTGPKAISWKDGRTKKSEGGLMTSISNQNRIKKKNGGFIAKGCGKVMNNRRKVTTIS